MNNLILGIVFLILALAGIIIRKTYFALPEHELKRRAEMQVRDEVLLYRAVAYGNSLRVLLWIYIGLTSAASFVFLARYMPIWAGLLVVASLLYIVFSLLPATEVGSIGIALTKLVTPGVSWLLNYLHRPLRKASNVVATRYVPGEHTGLYERYDYLALLDKQQQQEDSRLMPAEVEIIKRALTFSDKRVSDVIIPRKKVKTLLADDTVGPVLINDLHEHSQAHVLVKESKRGPVVGTLAFKHLGIKSHGKVRDVMDSTLFYLNEDDTLLDAIQAYLTTGRTMYVVVNSSEEYVGIVTMDSVVRELIGELPADEFDTYNSITAVASRHLNRAGAEETAEAEEAPEVESEAVKTDGEVVE